MAQEIVAACSGKEPVPIKAVRLLKDTVRKGLSLAFPGQPSKHSLCYTLHLTESTHAGAVTAGTPTVEATIISRCGESEDRDKGINTKARNVGGHGQDEMKVTPDCSFCEVPGVPPPCLPQGISYMFPSLPPRASHPFLSSSSPSLSPGQPPRSHPSLLAPTCSRDIYSGHERHKTTLPTVAGRLYHCLSGSPLFTT